MRFVFSLQTCVYLLALATALPVSAPSASAFWGKKEEDKQKSENPYSYTEKDLPNIRFFPVEEARWNGYEVRIRDWNKLTHFQKVRFLQQAQTEIEVNENSVVQGPDMSRTMTAMNETVKMLEQDPLLKEMPVMKYYYIMLQQNNSIRKAASLVKLSKSNP